MADRHSKSARSRNMSLIKGKNTAPELLVRKYLHKLGFRYRLHQKNLPGSPDIVLPKYKTVIFVNGCFWHGHRNCKYFSIPKTRSEWWTEKISKNINNDITANITLDKLGWNVLTIWGCELKKSNLDNNLGVIISKITKNFGGKA